MFRTARIFAVVLAFVAVGAALAQSPPSTKIRTTYEAGEQALRRGDLDEAEKAFRRVLVEAPSDPGARANLGVVYMRRKEWDRAIGEFRAAAKLAPQVSGIRLNIGLAYYRQGAYQDAIPEFEAVVREGPQSTQARQLLGLCYLFTERYAEAAAALDAVWTTANGDLSYLYALSVAAGNAGRSDVENKALARLLEVGNDSPELHLLIGKAYLNRRQDDRALAEFEQALQRNPTLPFLHYNIAVAYRIRHDFVTAKREFLKDVEIEPEVAYNYDELGNICYALEQPQEAERFFREAVRRDKSLGTSWYGLAKVYRDQKRLADALKALDQAAAIGPNSVSVHYLRAQLYKQMGRDAEAEKEWATVRRLKENEDRLDRELNGKYRDPQLGGEQK